MTDETANLVLELLRAMRGDMNAFRDEMRGELAAIRQRMDTMETELRGVTYVVTVSVGSLLSEVKDHDTRIADLEGARS